MNDPLSVEISHSSPKKTTKLQNPHRIANQVSASQGAAVQILHASMLQNGLNFSTWSQL